VKALQVRPRVFLAGVPLEGRDTVALLREEGFDHLVEARDGLTEEDLIVTTTKLSLGDITGVEKYLAWGANILRREAMSYDDKRGVIREVLEFAEKLGVRRQVLARIEVVTDELLMNALYDAPAAKYGCRSLFQGRGRPGAGPVGDKPVSLMFGCDGRYLAVGVRDAFGELRKSHIVDQLERTMVERRGPRLDGGEESGGGLGFYFVLSSVSRFVVNVVGGSMTEVIALFDLRRGARDVQTAARGFSFFQSPGQATSAQDVPGDVAAQGCERG